MGKTMIVGLASNAAKRNVYKAVATWLRQRAWGKKRTNLLLLPKALARLPWCNRHENDFFGEKHGIGRRQDYLENEPSSRP